MTTHNTTTKNIVKYASSCWLNINCGATAAFSGGNAPAASFVAKSLAAAKNPTRISSLNIFCHAAVEVTIINHTNGKPVIQAYLSLPDFTKMPVATHKAIAASI